MKTYLFAISNKKNLDLVQTLKIEIQVIKIFVSMMF